MKKKLNDKYTVHIRCMLTVMYCNACLFLEWIFVSSLSLASVWERTLKGTNYLNTSFLRTFSVQITFVFVLFIFTNHKFIIKVRFRNVVKLINNLCLILRLANLVRTGQCGYTLSEDKCAKARWPGRVDNFVCATLENTLY